MLVVDDHDVVHWGFRLLLAEQPWVKRCLAAGDPRRRVELTRRYDPDVALVDLFLGERSGAELCTSIPSESPRDEGAADLRRRLDLAPAPRKAAGASGFVSKDSSAGAVAAAVRRWAAGKHRVRRRSPRSPPRRCPAREREVLELMAVGATNREIAERLHLSPHTVKEHTSALYRKLDVRNRAEAVRRAERLGLNGRTRG